MIYRDTKLSKIKADDFRAGIKQRQTNKSEKQNKDKSKSGGKGEVFGVLKRHDITDRHKFNMTSQLRKDDKKGLLMTGDISELLKQIGKEKNQTIKTRKANMTEDDINKLFRESPRVKLQNNLLKDRFNHKVQQKINASQCQKKTFCQTDAKLQCLKTKTMRLQIRQLLGIQKDFADSIKFLHQQQQDKMLAALDQGNLQGVQFDNEKDKTAKFKQQFVIGKQVGQGAYASVRVAIWTSLNKKVAIKIYEKKKINEPQRRRSVRRQIKILQRIDHQNILKVYDALETNNHVNIIMQYVPGISLASLLKNQSNGRLSQKEAKSIFTKLVDALKYLHQQSICHRDIKLDNVLIDAKSNPKLIDFGFSTCLEKGKKVKMFCGTPSFMAPQIVSKTQYRGQSADVWALGVVLFVMISGVFPFKGHSDKELYQRICSSQYPKISVSRSLADLISSMLTVDPDKRITTEQILQHQWIKNVSHSKQPRTISRSGSYDMNNLGSSLTLSKRTPQSKQKKFIECYKQPQSKQISRKISTKPSSCTNKSALSFKFSEEKKVSEIQSPTNRHISRLTNKAYL